MAVPMLRSVRLQLILSSCSGDWQLGPQSFNDAGQRLTCMLAAAVVSSRSGLWAAAKHTDT